MPHTKLVVKITVREARFVRDGLPFRGAAGEASPYNPPVRRLVGECPVPSSSAVSGSSGSGQARPGTTAALVKREIITPSIGRFTFKLQLQPRQQPLKMWKAGQHVTLDFSGELDNGWSHMRDDDPQSLNDDFVRTFTVSKPPPVGEDEVVHDGVEVEITARKHGPVTGLLWKYHIRVGLEIPVLGFGGDESFQIAKADKSRRAVFVAGGVGITPLLAQAAGLLLAGGEGSDGSKNKGLVLLWSLRAGDLELAVDTFERIQGLAKVTRLFVTGDTSAAAVTETVGKIEGLGAEAVVLGRMTQSDVSKEKGAKYYLCASVEMQALVQEWLQGEEVVSESFNY
ncbi:hypothetical protein B0T17DRAFT_524611 [Bombardia bombarda]|uniref:FAD-binding FR-type domain-containing protein n=1 Tax=Bombardia bombarda TaxID=252184 RepID=A0AA39X986_9PEZI|nr:hypothetical protein B0T17DRAFT_524611 [Bombardia bombarda]